jgi:hypothetical protein
MGVTMVGFGWAASDLGAYLGRRCPGSETVLRVVCGALGVLAVTTVQGLVEMYLSYRRR